MANPADTTYAIVRETIQGTTPATPAFKYLDYIAGAAPKLDTKTLSSDVLKQNRDMAGLVKINASASWTYKTHFRRDTAMDLLLESGLSGTFSGNVLKASNVDSFHTIEQKMLENGTADYLRSTGMTVTKFGLSVDASSNAEVTFDMLGMTRVPSASIVTGATYTAPVQGPTLSGVDVGTLTIGGLSLVYSSLDLSVEHTREAKFGFGSAASFGTGTSGFRSVKLTVKAYRNGAGVYSTAASDVPVPVTFTLGSGTGNAYTFNIPSAVFSTNANDDISGSNAFIDLELMAIYDATAQTSISITKS